MKIKRKVLNYNLLGKGKDTIKLGRSFEDLPQKKALGLNRLTNQSISIQDGGSAKDTVKKDIRVSNGSVKFDMNRKHLQVKRISVLNSSLPSPAKKLALKMENTNLSCNSRLHEAKSLPLKFVGGTIKKTGLEKPLVKKIQSSLDFNKAEMENRYFMGIVICLCCQGLIKEKDGFLNSAVYICPPLPMQCFVFDERNHVNI